MWTPRVARTSSLRAAVVGAALALVLSGCGADGGHGGHSTASGSSSPAASAADHAEADLEFSAMMVPHHLQAVEMAALVPDRTSNVQVRELADRIRGAQQPEVDRMTGWLAQWGAAPMEDHAAMDGHGMDGMMSADDLRELGTLRDAAFDRRWLEMMVEHHEGAVTMAQQVLRDGRHPQTRALAEEIVAAQQQEISEMRAILAG